MRYSTAAPGMTIGRQAEWCGRQCDNTRSRRSNIRIRVTEARMIDDIQRINPKLQPSRFAWRRDREVLRHGKVDV